MTTKERIVLMIWCQKAVLSVKFQDAAIQNDQLKLLKKQCD